MANDDDVPPRYPKRIRRNRAILKPKEEKRGKGRPSSYRPEYAEQARQLCVLGYSDARLAEFFGVDPSTLCKWKAFHSDFFNALLEGREKADVTVAGSLFRSANGFTIEVNGEERYVPPNVGAQRFWLTNRQPQLWKEKVEVKEEVDLKIIPREELDAIYQKAQEEADERDRRIREERRLLIEGQFKDVTPYGD